MRTFGQERTPAFLGCRCSGHAAGATHVQALVGQNAEVGKHAALVIKRHISLILVACQFFIGQRTGCDDFRDQGKQAAVDCRVQFITGKTVGRDQDLVGRDAAPGRDEAMASVLTLPSGDRAAAVDDGAVPLGQTRQFPGVF